MKFKFNQEKKYALNPRNNRKKKKTSTMKSCLQFLKRAKSKFSQLTCDELNFKLIKKKKKNLLLKFVLHYLEV